MTKEEAIGRMLGIQEVLDKGMTRSLSQLMKAFYAEYGEYLQLVKGEWAWWLRDGKQFMVMDNEKVAGEAIDVLHFWLSIKNFIRSTGTMNDVPVCLVDAPNLCLRHLRTWDQVYSEYIKKARINLERWGRNPTEIDHLVGEAYL